MRDGPFLFWYEMINLRFLERSFVPVLLLMICNLIFQQTYLGALIEILCGVLY